MNQGRCESQATKRPVRRRKLNKYFLVTLSLILLLGVAVGVTIAYIIADGGSVTNTFDPGQVLCSVDESFAVTNDGDVNAYVRAAVVINWENDAGEINGSAPKEGINYTLTLGADWEKIGDYYYYKKVITPEGNAEKTSSVVTVSNAYGSPTGFSLNVEILAEAIQADGMGADSAYEAWTKVMPATGNN